MLLIERASQIANLRAAWEHVQRRGAAGGVDGVGVDAFARALESKLSALSRALIQGKYVPDPLLQVEIPKPGKSGMRRVGLPTVRDKVAQQAVRQIIEPVLDRRFRSCSYGYRPRRGPVRASRRLRHELGARRAGFLARRDVRDCFGSIPHAPLRARLTDWLADDSLTPLFEAWFQMIALQRGGLQGADSGRGIPQGTVLSPLLCNLVLHSLDVEADAHAVRYLRYADDLIVLGAAEHDVARCLTALDRVLTDLGMRFGSSPPIEPAARPFDFLGVHYGREGQRGIAPTKRPGLTADLERAAQNVARSPLSGIDRLQQTLEGYKRYYGQVLDPPALREIDQQLCAALARALQSLAAKPTSRLRRALEELPWLAASSQAERRELARRCLGEASAAGPTRHRRQERRARECAAQLGLVHLTHPGMYLSLRGTRLVTRRDGQPVDSVPKSAVQHIVLTVPWSNCSAAVIRWAAQTRIPITHVDPQGRVLAHTEAPPSRSAGTVRAQVRATDSAWASCTAQEIVSARLRSQRNLMVYFAKYECRRRPEFREYVRRLRAGVSAVLGRLRASADGEAACALRARYMGFEGQGAVLYWEGVRLLLDPVIAFPGRMRQGATDPVNAMLNYGYAILRAKVAHACTRVGLDPGLGVLHTPRADAEALVYDLMEPFRAPVVDRAALALLRRRYPPLLDADGKLSADTRQRIARAVQSRLAAPTQWIGTRTTMGAVLQQQCAGFARAVESGTPFRAAALPW